MHPTVPPAVRVVLYATARQAAGRSEITVAVPESGISVHALLDQLGSEHPSLVPIVAHSRLLRNGEYLHGRSGRLDPGDELAIHPPYSGG